MVPGNINASPPCIQKAQEGLRTGYASVTTQRSRESLEARSCANVALKDDRAEDGMFAIPAEGGRREEHVGVQGPMTHEPWRSRSLDAEEGSK